MLQLFFLVLAVPWVIAFPNCSEQVTCKTCISHSHLCYWCSQPVNVKTNKKMKRCGLAQDIYNGCTHNSVVEAETFSEILKNDPFSSEANNVVQLKPQMKRLKLPKDKYETNRIYFQPADNFPVDMYFVMDTSSTMKSTRKQLATLIQSITTKIGTLTKDFQLGFGSFVDKPIEPFTNTHPDVINNPCVDCIPAYGYRNHLNLSRDVDKFKTMMEDMRASGNIDLPEGGFDAIVQAVVCKDIIGWRRTSRKILLFFTDGPYHSAGDGKLAGIIEKNDLECHLDLQGLYTMSTTKDYPSIHQLRSVLSANKINLIIGTSQKNLAIYQKLSKHLESSYVGEFGDESKLEDIIYDNYKSIQQSVRMHAWGFNQSLIAVSFSTKCTNSDSDHTYPSMETDRCEDVKIGKQVYFDVTMRVLECFDGVEEVTINPAGIGEALVVEVHSSCQCPCAAEAKRSTECSNKGELVCGVCECDAGFYGEDCACEGGVHDEFLHCRRQPFDLVCSGRGECVCGSCQCGREEEDQMQVIQYQGKYCQCNNDTCYTHGGLVCSGHGECVCGECVCEGGFQGDRCDCPTHHTTCVASDGTTCNGKGYCECGRCVCNKDTAYKGPTCEDCPTCQSKCKGLVACVSCLIEHSANCSLPCGVQETPHDKSFFHSTVKLPEARPAEGEVLCVQKNDEGCFVSYIYKARTKEILALNKKECPAKPNLWLIIGTTVGGVLLMGILALVAWKVVVTVYDRREYLAFEKEGKATKWSGDDNPLYRKAVSNFQNPTFKAKRF